MYAIVHLMKKFPFCVVWIINYFKFSWWLDILPTNVNFEILKKTGSTSQLFSGSRVGTADLNWSGSFSREDPILICGRTISRIILPNPNLIISWFVLGQFILIRWDRVVPRSTGGEVKETRSRPGATAANRDAGKRSSRSTNGNI